MKWLPKPTYLSTNGTLVTVLTVVTVVTVVMVVTLTVVTVLTVVTKKVSLFLPLKILTTQKLKL